MWRGEGEEEEEAEGETAGRPPLHSLGKAQAAAHLYRLEESRREGQSQENKRSVTEKESNRRVDRSEEKVQVY